MNAVIQSLKLLLVSIAGWMGRRQQEVIDSCRAHWGRNVLTPNRGSVKALLIAAA